MDIELLGAELTCAEQTGEGVTVYVVDVAAGNQGSGGLTIWVMMAVLIGAMYFFMIRPQQRRRREVESMQSQIGPGDEVVTVGGLHGTIEAVEDDTVLLEIAPGVVTRYARPAISRVVASAADREADELDEADDEVDGDDTASDGDLDVKAKKIVNPD